MDAKLFIPTYKQVALWCVRWSNNMHQEHSKYPQQREKVVFCENEADANGYVEALEAAHRLLERDEHFYAHTQQVHLEAIKK